MNTPRKIQGQDVEHIAKGLGWFSISLGLAQLIVPGSVARFVGLHDDTRTTAIMRMIGLREIASGFGILSQRRPVGWVKSRMIGDLMDLSLLAGAMGNDPAEQDRVMLTTVSVLGVTALDAIASAGLDRATMPQGKFKKSTQHGIQVKHSITVNRPIEEVYQFWHQFENLPRFMSHLESVETLGSGRSHWKAKAPAGMSVEWDAEITEDRPNEIIAWRSLEDADVKNSGSVRFTPAPGNRGTEIRVELRYDAPGGKLGAAIAKLFGEEPGIQVIDDLRAFKQIMEIGEVLVSDGTIQGRRLFHRPAQPPENDSERMKAARERMKS